MDYYFISDNYYYLLGIEHIADKIDMSGNIICIDINEDLYDFHPAPGEVVVIAVTSNYLRQRIMRFSELLWCRLIILLNAPICRNSFQRINPCIMPWKMPVKRLINSLHKFVMADVGYHSFSARNIKIIDQLIKGRDVLTLSKQTGLSTKVIYSIRLNAFNKLGLSGCNTATGLLLCRDIFEIMQLIADSGVKLFARNKTDCEMFDLRGFMFPVFIDEANF